jgi:hypothetical protein
VEPKFVGLTVTAMTLMPLFSTIRRRFCRTFDVIDQTSHGLLRPCFSLIGRFEEKNNIEENNIDRNEDKVRTVGGIPAVPTRV